MNIVKYRLLISLFFVSIYLSITHDCIASEVNKSQADDSLKSSLGKHTSEKYKKEDTPRLIINTEGNKKSKNTIFKCWLCCCLGCQVER